MPASPRRLRAAALLALPALSCRRTPPPGPPSGAAADSAFAGVQARGRAAMGVDQSTAHHVFEDLPDGGRIVLDRDDPADTAGIRTIRAHMRRIAAAFARGDFATPAMVHARDVPGTAEMAARRAALTYTAADRPRGAEVRIRSGDPAAVAAVHAFLAFQRGDHRAPGHEGHAGHATAGAGT